MPNATRVSILNRTDEQGDEPLGGASRAGASM